MAEWGDVAWSAATPQYRKSQFILLVKELAARDEIEDATMLLVGQDKDAAEELYDHVDDALSASDAADEELEKELEGDDDEN